MVKGISRQVIVVHSPDRKLFDQAIFILSENALNKDGITDQCLLKEAQQMIRNTAAPEKRRKLSMYGPVWACGGALLTGFIWLLTVLV